LTRRLRAAVEEGDQTRIAEEHRALVRMVDKAAARGALHRNAAARKKAQADRLVAGSRSYPSALSAGSAGRVISISARANSSSPGSLLPPLSARSRSASRTIALPSSS